MSEIWEALKGSRKHLSLDLIAVVGILVGCGLFEPSRAAIALLGIVLLMTESLRILEASKFEALHDLYVQTNRLSEVRKSLIDSLQGRDSPEEIEAAEE